MIIRIRSSLGMTRLEVEPRTRLIALKPQIQKSCPEIASREGTLRLRKDGERRDLFANKEAGMTIDDLGIKHGDLFYLDCQTIMQETANEVDEIESLDNGNRRYVLTKVPIRWGSHAVMYSSMRWLAERQSRP